MREEKYENWQYKKKEQAVPLNSRFKMDTMSGERVSARLPTFDGLYKQSFQMSEATLGQQV